MMMVYPILLRRVIIAFDEIFNLSQIENKIRIYINDGNHFRPKDDIYREVLSFIYSTYGD